MIVIETKAHDSKLFTLFKERPDVSKQGKGKGKWALGCAL